MKPARAGSESASGGSSSPAAGQPSEPTSGGSTHNGTSLRGHRIAGVRMKGTTMAVVTTRQLLESGVHFGHQTRRWNPKMKRFIFNERNGIYIIDLRQSLTYIDKAYGFVSGVVARGGQILFVGTKKQAQETIAEQATRVGMPYVNQRWLGGMLTNFETISKRITTPEGTGSDGPRERRCRWPDQEGTAAACAARWTSWTSPSVASATWDGCRRPSGSSTPRRSTSPSTRPASCTSRSSPSSTPTAIPTRSTSRSRATTTPSVRSRC